MLFWSTLKSSYFWSMSCSIFLILSWILANSFMSYSASSFLVWSSCLRDLILKTIWSLTATYFLSCPSSCSDFTFQIWIFSSFSFFASCNFDFWNSNSRCIYILFLWNLSISASFFEKILSLSFNWSTICAVKLWMWILASQIKQISPIFTSSSTIGNGTDFVTQAAQAQRAQNSHYTSFLGFSCRQQKHFSTGFYGFLTLGSTKQCGSAKSKIGSFSW